MSDPTLAALTAAGIVYDRSDFADPHLDGPTALTVTADGRVYGHLAAWDTPHIGMGARTTPPKSPSGYKYFHQGVVRTSDGDLPVGKLTLGTGHAPVDGRTDAVAAAAHYDDTGTVAAAVRAGEDAHGIWLAGRIIPGTPPERVDELRLSGVSGDWRGIDGHYELVAALAVNVPGFPLPRTEELVAAGAPAALVAAGVVAPVSPPSPEEVESMVASAVKAGLDQMRAAERRRDAVVARVEAITASVVADRRARVAGEVERVQAARACDDLGALTAAADSGIPGHLPRDLRRYWTKGAGLNRWSTSPHPYTALTRALRSELPPKAQHMVNGLAANLFKAVFGIYPGQRKELTAAGEGASGDHSGDGMVALLPTAQDSERLAVPDGEQSEEMHLTIGYFPDVAMMPEDDAILSTLTDVLPGNVDGTISGHAIFNPDTEGKDPCAVYLVQADGLAAANQAIAPAGDYDAYMPHITAQYNPTSPLTAAGPVSFDRVRISRGGEYTDVPLGAVTAAGAKRRVRTQEGANRFGVSVGDLIPKAQELAGDLAEAAGNDVARVVDPKRTAPAKTSPPAPAKWKTGGPAVDKKPSNAPTPPSAKTHSKTAGKVKTGDSKPAAKPGSPAASKGGTPKATGETYTISNPADPKNPPKKTPSDSVPEPDKPQVKSNVSEKSKSSPAPAEKAKDLPHGPDGAPTIPADAPPPRKDTGAGTDHPMEEDESPDTGALGGKLLAYSDGRADYDDGSWTDGTGWHIGDPPATGGDAQPAAPQVEPADAAFNEPGPAPVPGAPVTDTDVPPRLSGIGAMQEDESPETGAHGGKLVEYSAGVAFYDDGTDTDGTVWRYSEPYEEDPDPNAIAASAARHARAMRALGYIVPNRRIGGARPKG
ncbi:hypothetical protein [Gordonia sp. (in: high G+C Gram-positive bacteria)]|uniref:hypothetical protein n=1 Tax=Gordonia sp. (in: high G+C Gram-positive bacteria) TaxID=84139 RepID=UPI0026180839|nr:hypothetical protein [Gordonia sp. (in: high G+C Gram-positive bacteria)]